MHPCPLERGPVVTIVHDLDAFRRKKITAERERYLLNKTDALIVHNPTMLDYMASQHFEGRLYNLQIFDFLTKASPKQYVRPIIRGEWSTPAISAVGAMPSSTVCRR